METPEPQRGWAYGLALVAFAAALLSKSIGVALPALLVVYGLCVERGRNARRLLVATIPFWCVALAFFAFKAVTLKSGTWAGGRAALTFRERVARPLETLSRYSLQLPMPIDLHNDYAPKLNPETLLGPVLVTGGALTLAAVGVAKLWRVSPPAAFVALWMALTILPVSNLIPLRARPIAEQRLYIPSVGWVILLAWLVMARGRPAHRALTALLLAAAALLAGLSAERYFAWRTGIALWTDSVAKSADRVRAYMNLGNEYLIDRRYAQAEKFFRKTIRLSPQTTDAYMNLAQTLRSQGRPSEALQVYRKAQAHDPRNPALHAVVAHVQAEMGDYESALNSFRLALRLYPRMPAAHNRLGQLYLALERPQDAVLPFRVAAGLEPDSPHHHFGLGNAFQMLGQSHRALACYAEAIRLSPTYKEAHFNAGESLQAMGQDELAERAFQVVLQLDPANWRAHFKLAEICQQRGNAALSAHHLDAAARLNPALLAPAPK